MVSQSEKRDCERLDLMGPAYLKILRSDHHLDIVHGVASDISATGMFVTAKKPEEPDIRVDVDLELPQLGERIMTSGKVVRTDEEGYAVKFFSRCELLDTLRKL